MKFIKQIALLVLMVAAPLVLPSADAFGEVLERVVAIVNDDIILLSEFEVAVEAAKKTDGLISDGAVLNEMINRMLLLKEAARLRIGTDRKNAADGNAVIKDYIDRRIKAFIHIPPEEIKSYYVLNMEQFPEKELYEVRDEIEKMLVARVLSEKLRKYINELRAGAFIRIQIKE